MHGVWLQVRALEEALIAKGDGAEAAMAPLLRDVERFADSPYKMEYL